MAAAAVLEQAAVAAQQPLHAWGSTSSPEALQRRAPQRSAQTSGARRPHPAERAWASSVVAEGTPRQRELQQCVAASAPAP
jgi:hypothetical protein